MDDSGGDGNWMPAPVGVPVCPPGLEYLTMIDQLIIHQKVELLEGMKMSSSIFIIIIVIFCLFKKLKIF